MYKDIEENLDVQTFKTLVFSNPDKPSCSARSLKHPKEITWSVK